MRVSLSPAALDLGGFVREFWPILVPVLLGLAAVYLLLPRPRPFPVLWGALLSALAVLVSGWWLVRIEVVSAEAILFYAFALLAVVSAGLLITLSNPVHAALSFAMVILSTCGLFLLLAAPFLMAATIIVYAGAIVVTFLFVIMLAQQHGPSSADQRSREPFLAALAGFVLLGASLCVLHRSYDGPAAEASLRPLDDLLGRAFTGARAADVDAVRAAIGEAAFFKGKYSQYEPTGVPDKLSGLKEQLATALVTAEEDWGRPDKYWTNMEAKRGTMVRHLHDIHTIGTQLRAGLAVELPPPAGTVALDPKLSISPFGAPVGTSPGAPQGSLRPRLPADNVASLGRMLFTDYLLAVEVAGFLLLVATIGAIAISARRPEGLR